MWLRTAEASRRLALRLAVLYTPVAGLFDVYAPGESGWTSVVAVLAVLAGSCGLSVARDRLW